MEQSLYISKTAHLKYWNREFSRLYFGMEFCERLLPSASQLKKALDFSQENGLDFTFVTPYVTDSGVTKVEKLIQIVSESLPESEIVFNDWGVLHLLKEQSYPLTPVMGRLLNKMKRGPRIANITDKIPPASLEYFMTPGISIPEIQEFLIKNNIARVEFDNLLQGLNLNGISSEIHLSLYLPFAFITTTRFCLMSSINHSEEMKIGVLPCKKECQQHAFQLLNPVMTIPLIRKGNTIFFSNEQIPQQIIRERKIDRIVIEPEIPL
jgi:hypothetical protein